jgi:hypothetical protein
MIRGSVLVIALLVNAPNIWKALAEQTISVESAAVHYLITVPIVAVLLALVRLAARKPAPGPARDPKRPAAAPAVGAVEPERAPEPS